MNFNVKLFPSHYNCCCGVNVRKGARIFAIILILFAMTHAVTCFVLSILADNWDMATWHLYDSVLIICSALVLVADKREEAWLYIPFIVVTFFTGVVAVLFAACGFFGSVFYPNFMVEFVYCFIPRTYFVSPAEMLSPGMKAHATPKSDALRIASIVLYIALMILGLFKCYASWVTLSAFYYVKNFDEYIPTTTANRNYDANKLVSPISIDKKAIVLAGEREVILV